MKMLVQIYEVPDGFGHSYGNMQYANYGVCCWEYADKTLNASGQAHKGPPQWINFREMVFYPQYPHPIAFRYFLKPGVKAHIIPQIEIRTDIADTYIQGIAVNLLRGKGIAF